MAGDMKCLFCNTVPESSHARSSLVPPSWFFLFPTREDTVRPELFNFWNRPVCSSFACSLLFFRSVDWFTPALQRGSERSLHYLSYLSGSCGDSPSGAIPSTCIHPIASEPVSETSLAWTHRSPAWENWEQCRFLVCRGLAQNPRLVLLTRVMEHS